MACHQVTDNERVRGIGVRQPGVAQLRFDSQAS